MSDLKENSLNSDAIRQRALARWENEGGAIVSGQTIPSMKQLPPNAVAYKRTPTFTNATVPQGLLRDHHTKLGVWGLIQVERGSLQYTINGKDVYVLTPSSSGVVEPAVTHCVTPLEDVAFFVEFYREEEPKTLKS